MLPSTPEGVLLQEGDARREPPIVLARRAGTPYRNGHSIVVSVAHPLEPAAPTAGSWHFRGDVRALALSHAGLLRGARGGADEGPPGVRGRGPAGARRRGGAMIGRAALRHKRFQQAGVFSCRTVRTRGRAAHRPRREARRTDGAVSPPLARRPDPPGRRRGATDRPAGPAPPLGPRQISVTRRRPSSTASCTTASTASSISSIR